MQEKSFLKINYWERKISSSFSVYFGYFWIFAEIISPITKKSSNRSTDFTFESTIFSRLNLFIYFKENLRIFYLPRLEFTYRRALILWVCFLEETDENLIETIFLPMKGTIVETIIQESINQ